MNDTERIDWLQKAGCGIALINDDNGYWAVATEGFQTVPEADGTTDIETTYFIEKKWWKSTVRKAIDYAVKNLAIA